MRKRPALLASTLKVGRKPAMNTMPRRLHKSSSRSCVQEEAGCAADPDSLEKVERRGCNCNGDRAGDAPDRTGNFRANVARPDHPARRIGMI